MENIIRGLVLLTFSIAIVNCTTLPTSSQAFTPTIELTETLPSPEPAFDAVEVSPQPTSTVLQEKWQTATPVPKEASPTPETISYELVSERVGNISFVNQIGGSNSAIAIEGDYAYMGVGPRLMVFDIADPTNPTVMGQTAVFRGTVRDITIQNNLAYIVTPYGLYIVDLSNPIAPVQLGFHAYDEYQNRTVSVIENIAYVTSDDQGLSMIDVSDPTAPTELGVFADSSFDIEMNEHLIYLAGEGLRILDISKPGQPEEINFYQTSERSYRIIIEGDSAYVKAFDAVLVLDISDPMNPVEVSNFRVDKAIFDFAVNDGLVYIVEGGRKLHILDSTSPSELRKISTYDLPHQTRSLAVKKSSVSSGVYAYLGWGGLGILDVSQPTNLKEVGRLDMMGDARGVSTIQPDSMAQKGTNFLLVGCKTGVCTVDISDLTDPFLTGFYNLSPYDTHDVKVVEDLAFVQIEPFAVAEERTSLIILDVSDPTAPRQISAYPYPGPLEVIDQKAYIAAGEHGLHILDISTPSNPQRLGLYQPGNWMWDIAVSGQTAYVTGGGLLIINISDPTDPKLAGSHPAPDPLAWYDIILTKDTVYTTGTRGGTYIFDVTNPTSPKDTRNPYAPTPPGMGDVYNLEQWGPNAAQIDDLLFLHSDISLYMLDVSTPNKPNILDSYELFIGTASIVVDQEYIYVATGDSGVHIFRH